MLRSDALGAHLEFSLCSRVYLHRIRSRHRDKLLSPESIIRHAFIIKRLRFRSYATYGIIPLSIRDTELRRCDNANMRHDAQRIIIFQ